MMGHVHVFDAREGGTFRISLTYQDLSIHEGQNLCWTRTLSKGFVELVPYSKIVEVVEFELQDPAFAGEMRIEPCRRLPEDNEQGCNESLQKLAALIE